MKRIATSVLMFVALAGSASANPFLDLIPIRVGPYVGLRAGYSTSVDPLVGANVGYDVGLLRVEANYDRLGFRSTSSNLVTGNLIAQLPFGKIVPYALAGAGYTWRNSPNYFADTAQWSTRSAVWNIGGGLRYELNNYVEFDLRYRLVQPVAGTDLRANPFRRNDAEHLISIGTNLRF